MQSLVILGKQEEEHLVAALEVALHVRSLRQLFLWTQGQFQGLLPHEIMVCVLLTETDQVERIECLHSRVFDPGLIKRLSDPVNGLTIRLVHFCRNSQYLPCGIGHEISEANPALTAFQVELDRFQLGNVLLHGTGRLLGCNAYFALFSLPEPPTERQAFFFELLLPSLYLAFQRVATLGKREEENTVSAAHALLTEREIEVLRWVTRGKSNFEIGVILDLSALTVKNHMQKIYRKLDVHNRAQAVSRCHVLQLFDPVEMSEFRD